MSTSEEYKLVGRLNKEVIRQFIEFSCERQLFLNLGNEDARWIEPLRALHDPAPPLRAPTLLREMGQRYEQDVYGRLRYSGLHVMHNLGAGDLVVPGKLNPQLLRALDASLEPGQTTFLLEYEWPTPEALIRWMLQIEPDEPLPILNPSERCRPDIIAVERRAGRADRALSPEGQGQQVGADDTRLAIHLIDIKHTNPDNVGKKQFSELLFYAHSMAHYLAQMGLDERFYVSLDRHGIWPLRNLNRARLQQPDDVYEQLEQMSWDNYSHIFSQSLDHMRRLYEVAPLPIEELDVNIQPACARCLYVNDCKRSLGYEHGQSELSHIDVRLVPCTSASISEQLRDLNYDNVEDLNARLGELELPTHVPSPLYAERPLLMLKARALSQGKSVLPSSHDGPQAHHMSMAMPYGADAIITFNAEADPTNDCVFAFGVSLDLRASAYSPWVALHDRWWASWSSALSRYRSPSELDLNRALALVSDELIDYHVASSRTLSRQQVSARLRDQLGLFARQLWRLQRSGHLSIEREPSGHYRARYDYAFISQGLEDLQERRLCFEMVRQCQGLLELTSIYESIIATVATSTPSAKSSKEPSRYLQSPDTAIFYWSTDQLEHIQALLERHLAELLTDPEICPSFHQLLMLLNPSDSSIERDYLHKKVYDLRKFAETSIGLPQIINYTWHEVAHQELPHAPRFSRQFWPAHFNYMDFLAWHDYLNSQDNAQAEPLREQTQRKAKTLASLARELLKRARQNGLLVRSVKPHSARKISDDAQLIRPEYNFLARAWALYAKLTASVQAQEAQTIRLNYPAHSIGKLVAAQVSDLRGWVDERDDQRFGFRLTDISTNVKMHVGSYVLLIHQDARALASYELEDELVIIEQLRWDGEAMCYHVEAKSRRNNHPAFEDAQGKVATPAPGQWYLYPHASDTWSFKLFEGTKDTLYTRYDLGVSWLGDRFAAMQDLLNAPLEAPKTRTFSLPELYAYAPALLLEPSPSPGGSLKTQATPAPDPSQQAAIELALSQPVSCIQGPPGTGKSQTIAALIDEFIARHQGPKPPRILVTSASYVPLNVVLDNIAQQRDASGQPTPAAKLERIFLRSSSRAALDRDDVRDLYRDGSKLVLDGEPVKRSRSKHAQGGQLRLEDALKPSFIMFAPAQQLFYLGRPSTSKSMAFDFVHDDFAFDLIIIDEASQQPIDQALSSLCLVRRGHATITADERLEGQAYWQDREALRALRVAQLTDLDGSPLPREQLTRVVVVGDHNQLPPVQQVNVSKKLEPILGSLFAYYVLHHQVPSQQLMTNYRSREEIVGYTRHLRLYERDISTFHVAAHAYPALPTPKASVGPPWVQELLDDAHAVNTIIHNQRYETAVSPLEAEIACAVVGAFFEQLGIDSATRELEFWREDIGIVAPHNAQGRLIIRLIAQQLLHPSHPDSPRTFLDAQALEAALRETIYTVEKFQGSARTLIIASMGISATTQLAAEETFMYDMNRLNVLTSRARQKMLMICSESFLDYTPQKREVVSTAARFRDYALSYCNRAKDIQVSRDPMSSWARWRWHDPQAPIHITPAPTHERPAPPPKPQATTPATQPAPVHALAQDMIERLSLDPSALDPTQRALLLELLKRGDD